MILQRLQTLANVVACILLLLTCLLTFADVVGRNGLGSPVPGATELTELALVGMTFLLYPQIAFRQQHIVIDLLDTFTGTFVRRLQQAVSGLLGAAIFVALAWRLWILGGRAMDYGDQTAYLAIPIYPAHYFMSVMCGLTAVAFAAIVVTAFTVSADALQGSEAKQPAGVE